MWKLTEPMLTTPIPTPDLRPGWAGEPKYHADGETVTSRPAWPVLTSSPAEICGSRPATTISVVPIVAVPGGHGDAVAGQVGDEGVGAGQFRCEGHHAQRGRKRGQLLQEVRRQA